MSLRARTITAFAVLTVIFVVVLVSYSRFVILRSFLDEERAEITDIVDDARHAVNTFARRYHELAAELGARQSVARSMITEPVPKKGAPAPAFDDALIDAVGAEFILFVDSQHRLVHASGTADVRESASSLTAHIRDYPELLYTVFNGGISTAILPSSTGHALVGIDRIENPGSEQPLGYVMVGHILDDAFADRLSDTLHRTVAFSPGADAENRFSPSSASAVTAVSDSLNRIDILFRSENGSPAMVASIDAPRSSLMNARSTLRSFMVFFGIAAFCFAVAAAFIQNMFVLRRLYVTIDSIEHLERMRGSGMRLAETESGRLGHLARSINRLLDRLEEDREELAAQERERASAAAASEYKSTILSNVSHEIRTPINGIIGMTELLQETRLDDTQGELVQVLDIETRALLGLINDILDLSKLEAGKVEAERIDFSLHDMLKPVVMVNTLRARKKGLDFHLYIDPDIPYDLNGDPLRVGQVLTNLVSNAMKFTPTGSITVSVEQVSHGEHRREIAFTVTDTGVGIPPERQNAIFESFSQADASTTRRYGGSGLGLSIVSSLVGLLGGQVSLKSKVGAGSSFTATIPFRHADTPTFEMDTKFPPLSTLVITRSDAMKRTLSRYLPTVNAAAAFTDAAPAGGPYDLVLIDYGRGTKEDRLFFESVLDNHVMAGADIVLLTYPDVDVDALNLTERGFTGVLHKPLSLLSLLPLMYVLHDGAPKSDFFEDETWFSPIDRVSEKVEGDYHVLLVEDYPVNQQVAIRHLVRVGIKVDLAENGRDALTMFEDNDYDLILMDIQMPVMDGFTATARIREREAETGVPEAERVPIIALTAHAQEKYRDECRAKGMDDYIAKPLRKESLIRNVRSWLETGHAPDSPAANGRAAGSKNGNGSPAPIDVAGLLEEFDNDAAFCADMITDFFTFTEKARDEIRAAIDDLNPDALHDAAHAAKGGARSIRAAILADILQRIEDAGAQKDFGTARIMLNDIENAMTELRTYLGDHPVNA